MLPEQFLCRMEKLLGEEYESFLESYSQPRFQSLRINHLKDGKESVREKADFFGEEVPWALGGYYYKEGSHPGKHPFHEAGVYYIQEASAMAPACALGALPGERILDLCAAPGGKATELGARLGREGLLVANDLSSSRAKGLLKNIEVFGIGNVLVLSEEPGKLCDHFPEYFDKILIDAPCSGEGMFRKDKKMVKAWEEHGPEFFSNIQRGIILKAARMLKPGGMLLYSTCTFDARENEQVIGHLLAACPEFCVMPMEGYEGFLEGRPELSDPVCRGLKETVRIFPHRMDGEGHYLALLKKKGTAGKPVPARERSGRGKEKLPEELKEFLEEVSVSFDSGRMDIRGERVYYMPQELPDVRGIRFLRTGLLLGELKKKRFEPSQALAMYLKKEEYRKTIDFGAADERIFRYLKGETLEVSDLAGKAEKGWYLVCVDSYPLGWGKLSKGTLKNKYLPGWRLC